MEFKIELKGNKEYVQFNIEDSADRLWLSAEMGEGKRAYLYLFDPNGRLCGSICLGMSGFPGEIYISETVCTRNGLRHKPAAGAYTLAIVPFLQVEASVLTIRVETRVERFYPKEFRQDMFDVEQTSFDRITETTHRYYKGDFHGHTIFSDGHQTIHEAVEVLKQNQMDFMAFTEHNTIAFGVPTISPLIIPSFELTLSIGHMNVHGISGLDDFLKALPRFDKEEALWEYAIQSFGKQGNLSLNHMFMKPWHFHYEDFDLAGLNTIEIICDPTYETAPQANDKAIKFLDFLWDQGLQLYGIGGSDSHNKPEELYEGASEPSIYGDPATYVYCQGLSVENIIAGIRKGHCYVARYGALEISIGGGQYLPGDLVGTEEQVITYKVNIGKNHLPCIGRFICNGKTVKEVSLGGEQTEASYSLLQEINSRWWFRFGLYDLADHAIAYVNPIYNIAGRCQDTHFKILKENFEKFYD